MSLAICSPVTGVVVALDDVPDLVVLSEVTDDLDAHELREQWQAQAHSPTRGAPAWSTWDAWPCGAPAAARAWG